MGRRQLADRSALLDAAECVVRRHGGRRLTLEAVAAEAGVSKASVLYECKSKRGLVQAVIERRIALDQETVRAHAEALGETPNAPVRAQVAAAAEGVSEEDRCFFLSLLVALAEDPEMLAPVRDAVAAWIAEIDSDCATPRGALLAFLALEGLRSLERFDIHRFAPEERRRILGEIAWLTGLTPQPIPIAAADRPAETTEGVPPCTSPHTSRN